MILAQMLKMEAFIRMLPPQIFKYQLFKCYVIFENPQSKKHPLTLVRGCLE